MNRAERRKSAKSHKRATPQERRRARRHAEQLFIWRYCENNWWRMTSGWQFRGMIAPDKWVEAHNLALALPLHWHAISITYLQDEWGKKYRMFGFARTNQQFIGIKQGICPLLDSALRQAEDGVNAKHIYGRGMIFAPWSQAFDSLIPLLRMKKEQMRLTDHDLEELTKAEEDWKSQPAKQHYFTVHDNIDDEIAALLEEA